MENKDWNLSDKIENNIERFKKQGHGMIRASDVKEFIRRLKFKIDQKRFQMDANVGEELYLYLEELAGEKLK